MDFSSDNRSRKSRYFALNLDHSEGIKTMTGLPLETASDTMEIDSADTTIRSHKPKIPPTTPVRLDSFAITRSGQRPFPLKVFFKTSSAQAGVRREEVAKRTLSDSAL